jgi:hypothetical protein
MFKLINSIKKGGASAKAAPLGVGLVAFGETVQESKDLFRGYLLNGSITKAWPESHFQPIVKAGQLRHGHTSIRSGPIHDDPNADQSH